MNRQCNGPLTRYVKLRVGHAPGMPGTFSPAVDFKGNCLLAIPACITTRASCTCRDACRDCLPAVCGENVPGIAGACATRNFTYLARGPWASGFHCWAVLPSTGLRHRVRGWGSTTGNYIKHLCCMNKQCILLVIKETKKDEMRSKYRRYAELCNRGLLSRPCRNL